jgi:hypothetical protein
VGVLTEVVVAEVAEAPEVLVGPRQPRWTTLQLKGLDTIKLGTLAFILQDRDITDVDAVVDYSEFELLASDSDEGPWVFRIPDDLITSLATAADVSLAEVSSKWAETEELEMDSWSEQDASEVVGEIAGLARLAGGRPVLLWMSL